MKARRLALALLVVPLAAAAPAPADPDLPPPIPRRFAQALATLASDPEPEHLAADVHFPTSNEEQHHLWRPAVTGLGGVFVGVGTDQNYLLAGWSRPEVLILMDFDQMVVDLHQAYFAIFKSAKTPQEFVAAWAWKRKKAGVELLEKEIADPVVRARVAKAFLEFRAAVELRLKHLIEVYRELKIPTFLDDPAQYQYLAALVKAGQVHAVRGDFRTGAALTDIGRWSTEMKLPVRAVYLSNAERYFQYTPAFRASVKALPFDDRSVVLRTVGLGSDKSVDPYFYVVQEGKNFQAWVQDTTIAAVTATYRRLEKQEVRFLYRVNGLPADPPLPGAPPVPRKQ